jgi:hypothetical protein
MFGVRTRVVWDRPKVYAIVETMPSRGHAVAAQAAAEAAAARIGGQGTGALAADVRRVKPMGRLSARIGSNLPYAAIEHFGGTIHAKNFDAYGRQLLYIRPGEIVATAPSVFHTGKRYLDVVPAVYIATMPRGLARFFPR